MTCLQAILLKVTHYDSRAVHKGVNFLQKPAQNSVLCHAPGHKLI